MYVAYPAQQGCRSCGRAVFDLLYFFPIPCAIVLGSLVIAFVVLRRRIPSSSGDPAEEAPPKSAHADVVSVNFTETVQRDRPVARILLRVHIPGSEPYPAEIKEPIGPEQADAGVRPGGTVAVTVDSANPQKVWLEPPYAAPTPGPTQIRFQRIFLWIVVIAVPAAIVSLMIAGIVAGHLFPL
ncbi:hypothetical protein [Mycobacterium sp. 1081908.1]|uniref:hypothetical protein n=1 Tax=Mycobacterium sp. 1081908.1 TaxID=1834066 RepID=UPI000AC3CE62|nr:hypothetical protein [Mycobacterium sp. 1081908.1]